MNQRILNKEFQHPADGWYQIEAMGNHPNRAAGIVQVIDQDGAASIVNRFNADAAAGQLRHGNEMLIDHEHFSDQPDQETRAYGWLQELQNREDGIYGRIRWTSTGKAAVDGGDYRFFSTEYDPADLQPVKNVERKSVRPLRLSGLTLTNMNNNRGQKPITNRGAAAMAPAGPAGEAPAGTREARVLPDCGGAPQSQNFATADAAADSKQPTKVTNKKMKTVCTLLGLSADADEASVHTAVSKLLNRGDITPDALTTLKNRATALESENQTLLGEQVTGLLAEYGIKDAKIINRLTPALTPLKNRAERLQYLADFGFKPVEAAKAATKVLNRGGGAAAIAEESAAGADEKTVARKITNRANELKGALPGRSFDSCWKQAAQEVAEKS